MPYIKANVLLTDPHSGMLKALVAGDWISDMRTGAQPAIMCKRLAYKTDVVTIIGAGLAGIMFFWVLGKKFVLKEVNKARTKPIGNWFYPLAKYVFCSVCVLVLIAGALLGGIG